MSISGYFSCPVIRQKIQEHPVISAVTFGGAAVIAIVGGIYAYNRRQSSALAALNPMPTNQGTTTRLMQLSTPRIVHLAQLHYRSENANNPEEMQCVWASQKAVAQYLLQHPNAIVFRESQTETSEHQNLLHKLPQDVASVQRTFQGWNSSDLETLNEFQKQCFVILGAALTLHYLGKIHAVHRAISPEKQASISMQIQQEFRRGNCDVYSQQLAPLLFDQREQALVDEVRTFLNTTKIDNPNIVFTYGFGHNFSRYFDPRHFERIDMDNPPPIQKAPREHNLANILIKARQMEDSISPETQRGLWVVLQRARLAIEQGNISQALKDYELLLGCEWGSRIEQSIEQMVSTLNGLL